MILDAETLELVNAIESLLEPAPSGEIKPELMESVLEVSTDPCPNTAAGGRAAARAAPPGDPDGGERRSWRSGRPARTRSRCGRTSGSSRGPRYRDLISALRFVARQELIFGMHVHVGVDDPDKAIHVANGMRVHMPVLLGLSANSPFWRADATGLASTRTPIFRAFPRVGIPPTYKDWEDYERRIEFMIEAQGDRGLHLPVARRAPAPELRHGRGPGDGLPDPHRAHARAGGARPGAGQGALRALRRRQAALALPVRDARREQVARRPARPRRRARRPAALRPRPDPGAGAAAARPDARALPGPRLAGRARGGRGSARARQRRRAAGRRLRGQPRPARGDGARSSPRRPCRRACISAEAGYREDRRSVSNRSTIGS